MSGLDDDWEILPRQTSKPKAPIMTLQSSEEESRQIEEEIRRQLMSRQERESQIQLDHQNDDSKTVSREESTESAVSVSLDTLSSVVQQEEPISSTAEVTQSESSDTQTMTEEIIKKEDNTPLIEATIPTSNQIPVEELKSDSTIRKMATTDYETHADDSLPPNTELKVIFGSLLAMAVHSIIFSPKAVEAF